MHTPALVRKPDARHASLNDKEKALKQKKEVGKALGRVPLSQLALQKGSIDNKLTCSPEPGPVFRGRSEVQMRECAGGEGLKKY